MKNKKVPLTDRLLIAIGLLLTSTPQLLRYHFKLPDFVLGAIIGVGLAMEFTALIRIRRFRKANYCALTAKNEATI